MSASRPERNRQRPRPYQRLPQSIALQMTSVVKRLESVARSWTENGELLARVIELVEEVQNVNEEFAKLIGVVAQNPLSPYSGASASTHSFASEFSRSSYQAYHSPSSVDLLTSNVDAMLVDQHIYPNPPLDDLADFVMGDEEATRRLIVQIEALLNLGAFMSVEDPASIRTFNRFNRGIAKLAQLAPVLDDIIRAGKNLLILTDYAGPGWVTVLQDTVLTLSPSGSSSAAASSSAVAVSPPSVSSASPASRMALRVFNKLITWHNESALDTLQKDVALGRKVRLIEACSLDIFRGAHYILEAGLVDSRMSLQAYIRTEMHERVASGWYWFSETRNHHTSTKMPSIGHLIDACVDGREEIENLIKKPIGEEGEENGGILGELGSMITLVGTAFYFVETAGGTAYMACMLEAKYPGISVNDEEKSRGGRPFIDNFPLAAFCLILTLILVTLREMEIIGEGYLQKHRSKADYVPDFGYFLEIMGTKRLEPIAHRALFLELYNAFLPHADLILGPLDRQAFIKTTTWLDALAPNRDRASRERNRYMD